MPMTRYRNPKTIAAEVRFLLALMDAAITSCESALHSFDVSIAEANIVRAKKAYGDALKHAGRISFNARDVTAFEWNSIRLERAIGRLQKHCNAWKNPSSCAEQTKVVNS